MKKLSVLFVILYSFIASAQITSPGSCNAPNILQITAQGQFTNVTLNSILTSYTTTTYPLSPTCNNSYNGLLITWFQFTATGQDLLLEYRYNLGTSPQIIYEVSGGACGALRSTFCGIETARNGTSQLIIPALPAGQTYKLSLIFRTRTPNFDISLSIVQNAQPKVVLSTRRGGNWNSAATWVGGVLPFPGDSVIIDDSAKVSITSLFPKGMKYHVGYLQLGRNLTNHSSMLFGNPLEYNEMGQIRVTGDFVSLSNDPVLDRLFIEIEGNFRYRNDFSNLLSSGGRVLFVGSGQKSISKTFSQPMQDFRVGISVSNPQCSLSIDSPLKLSGTLNLDSGTIITNGNLLVGSTSTLVNFSDIAIPVPSIQRVKGTLIGIPVLQCPTCTSLAYIYGSHKSPIDSMTAGTEYLPNISLAGFRAESVSLLRIGRIQFSLRSPVADKSWVVVPQDTIYTISLPYPFANNYIEENNPSGFSALHWRCNLLVGQQGNVGTMYQSARGTRHLVASSRGVSSWLVKVHDQSPGQLTASFNGDLTALRGKSYVQLTGTGALQDSGLVTMMLHPTDSLQDSRWDLCLAQAPNPGGPWKAVSPRDSSFSTRNFRRARVRFADGPYFAIGSRQLELNVKLNRLILPSSYEAGCVTSTGLPLTYIVENLGARAIDSIELGFRTNNQLVTTMVRLTRPLPSMGYDTLVIQGPLGLDATTTTPQPLRAWVAYPGAGNVFDDTIKTVFTVVTPSLPFRETFDTISSTTNDRARILNQSPVAGWHVRYNPTNHYRNSTDLTRGYAIRHTGSGNKVLGWRLRSPITEAAVTTPGLNLSAGRWYLGYNMAEDLFSGTQVDSFRVQYSTDCGFSWGTIKKRSLQDLGRCCAVRPFNNSIVAVDSIDLSTAARTSFRFVVDNAHLYYLSLSAVQVSSTLTSLSVPIASKEASWYPNPATDAITYEGAPGNLRIISTTGKVLMQKEGLAFGETIMVTGLPSGIYLLQVQTGYGLVSKRVVKK